MEVTTFFLPNVASHSEEVEPPNFASMQQVYPTLNFSTEKETKAVPNSNVVQRPATLEGLDSLVCVISLSCLQNCNHKIFHTLL